MCCKFHWWGKTPHRDLTKILMQMSRLLLVMIIISGQSSLKSWLLLTFFFFFSFFVVLYCFRIKCKDYISMYHNVPSLTSLGRAGKATRVQQPQKRMWKHGKCVARRCGFHLSCTVGSTAFNKFSVLLTWTLLSLRTFVKKVLEEHSSYLKVKQKNKTTEVLLK